MQNADIDDEVMALLKATPKGCNIDPATWEAEAVNRSRWYKVHLNNTAHFDGNATAQLVTRPEALHAAATNPLPHNIMSVSTM